MSSATDLFSNYLMTFQIDYICKFFIVLATYFGDILILEVHHKIRFDKNDIRCWSGADMWETA